jgi:hypothetical protein
MPTRVGRTAPRLGAFQEHGHPYGERRVLQVEAVAPTTERDSRTFQRLPHVTGAAIHRPERMHRVGFQVDAHIRRSPGKTVAPLAWRDSGHGSQRGAFPYGGVPSREQPDQTGKRPAQPGCHWDNRCGSAGPGRKVILIPSWLPFIMPPKHVAAQRTFGAPWFLLQIVCGHWRLLFDSDAVNMHGLEPVTTRIDGDDPTPYPAAPLHRAYG